MSVFVKFSSLLVALQICSLSSDSSLWLALQIYSLSSDKSNRKRRIFKFSFSASLTKLTKFDAGNVFLFQIKVFARNTKETTLARYFIKVTARPCFTQLRVIIRINGVHYPSYA